MSEYPNFGSGNKKRGSTLFFNHSRSKNIKSPEVYQVLANTKTKSDEDTSLPDSFTDTFYLNPLALKYSPPHKEPNANTLLASISNKLIFQSFPSIPDTIKVNNSNSIDSTTTINTKVVPVAEIGDKHSIEKKQKNATTFANISFISALLIIPSIFVLPGLFLLLIPAAIIFGILGLKSPNRKRARSGIIIAVCFLLFFILFALAYAGVMFS